MSITNSHSHASCISCIFCHPPVSRVSCITPCIVLPHVRHWSLPAPARSLTSLPAVLTTAMTTSRTAVSKQRPIDSSTRGQTVNRRAPPAGNMFHKPLSAALIGSIKNPWTGEIAESKYNQFIRLVFLRWKGRERKANRGSESDRDRSRHGSDRSRQSR